MLRCYGRVQRRPMTHSYRPIGTPTVVPMEGHLGDGANPTAARTRRLPRARRSTPGAAGRTRPVRLARAGAGRPLLAFANGSTPRRWDRPGRPRGRFVRYGPALLQGLRAPCRRGLDRDAGVALPVRHSGELGLAPGSAARPRRAPRAGPPNRRPPAIHRRLLRHQRQRLLRRHRADRHLSRRSPHERLSGARRGAFAAPRLPVPGPARLGIAGDRDPRHRPDDRRHQAQHGSGAGSCWRSWRRCSTPSTSS